MSLADIWDEPVIEPPPPPPEASTSNGPRRKRALFLSDSEDDDAPVPSRRTQSPSARATIEEPTNDGPQAPDKSELDALFAGLDDDDPFGDVEALDLDKVKKRAEAKVTAKRATLPSTMQSTLLGSDGTTQQDRAKGDNGVKTKRVIPKLNEERLLGQDGFPKLLKEYKSFKPSGKGREAQDLDKLFRLYHGWTHRLFPKYQFRDTVDRVEKLCRSRRMTVNLRVWRDEAHGVASKPDDDASVTGSSDDEREGRDQTENSAPQEENNVPQQRVTTSPGSSRPSTPITRRASAASTALTVPPSTTDVDDMDIDALLREEEELMNQIGQSKSAPGPSYKPATEDDDDDALWSAAGGALNAIDIDIDQGNVVKKPAAVQVTNEADDEDMWNMIDEVMQDAAPSPPAQPQAPPRPQVHEAPKEAAPVAPAEEDGPTVGAEWDDMYE